MSFYVGLPFYVMCLGDLDHLINYRSWDPVRLFMSREVCRIKSLESIIFSYYHKIFERTIKNKCYLSSYIEVR